MTSTLQPLSITDALIVNKSEVPAHHNRRKKKCMVKTSIIAAILILLTLIVSTSILIATKNESSSIMTSDNHANTTNSINNKTHETFGRSSACYPRNICNSHWMDKTNGDYRYWECGKNCAGGQYYTDGGCNCACIPSAPCEHSEDSQDDLCEHSRDYSHRNANPSSYSKLSTCLADPPQLVWQPREDIYYAIMQVDAKYMSFNTHPNGERPCNFWTRVHSDAIPSLTMTMKPGNTYSVLLKNNLGPNHPNDPNTWNDFRLANTTNLHVHGLHISGEPPGDNLVRIAVDPGQQHLYTYNVPCNEVAGTYLYHSHFHGSAALQIGGGMAGLLIIQQEDNKENYPDWLLQMPQKLIQIQRFNLKDQGINGENFNKDYDSLSDYQDIGMCLEEFWLVNGQYQPSICIDANTFYNFRMSHVDTDYSMALYIEPSGCELYLIAKDGVTLNDAYPRPISHLYFTMATRTDVAITCAMNGGQVYRIREGHENTIIATIDVWNQNNEQQVDIFSERLNTILRPNYLSNLMGLNANLFQQFNMEMRRDNGVNGNLFFADVYLNTLQVDTLQQWNLITEHCDAPHPFHLHVNHFQVIECDNGLGFHSDQRPDNWILAGDWHDILDSSACVRFVTDLFGGDLLYHCHKLNHEDFGVMAQSMICGGGCGAQWEDIKCSQDPTNVSPCLYTQFADYCALGNPGQFEINWYAKLNSYFRLVNKKSGLCVTYYTYSCSCGRSGCLTCYEQQMTECDDSNSRYWIMDTPDANNEYFRMKNTYEFDDFCLRFNSGSGAGVCQNTNNYYFRMINVNGEYFQLQDKDRGLCVFQNDGGVNIAECGTKGEDEYWYINHNSWPWYVKLNSYFRLVNKESGLCVTYYTYSCSPCGRSGCSTCSGQQMTECDENNSRYWIMYTPDANNEYFRMKNKSSGFCLRFNSVSAVCQNTNNYYFRMINVNSDGGYFQLQDKDGGLCVFQNDGGVNIAECGTKGEDEYWYINYET